MALYYFCMNCGRRFVEHLVWGKPKCPYQGCKSNRVLLDGD